MRRRVLALCLPALAALLLAACGGPAAVRARHGTVRIVETEYRLTPQDVVAPAGRLTLVVVDRGRLIHNLALERVPHDPSTVVEPLPGARSATLHPGQSTRLRVTLRPGTYRLLCTISNHEDLGQYGTLHVEP